MSVDFKHIDYSANLSQVMLTRDIYDGVDSSKKYLYKLERESEESIRTRQDNATLKNFVKRSAEAFVGMIFRKQVELSGYSDRFLEVANKIDKTRNINIFSRRLATDLIVDGKVYVAVDSEIGGIGYPYATVYNRSQVINWRYNSDGTYQLVVIKEYEEIELDEFETKTVEQYRVYKDDGNIDIYRNSDEGIYLFNTIETEYDYVPVVEFLLSDIPPLYDVAKLTAKHMNRTSIKDKYLDMCATPVPIVWSNAGEDEDDPTKPVFVVGAEEGFVFGSKDEEDFQWRELSGTSIDKLQEDLAVIEEDITTGIIRAASSDNSTVKTATQAYYEAAESANRVIVIANELEHGLNKVFDFLVDIGNFTENEEARVIINKDFNAIQGNSDSVRLLWEVYLGGAISIDTFLDSLSKFELVDIGSVRDELTRIENDKFVPEAKTTTDETVSSTDNRTVSAEDVSSEE